MIQFNLLPDVKLQYIKAEQTRRMVTLVSMLVSGVAIASLLVLVSANSLQSKHLKDLNKDIKSESATIQKQPDLNKVLTIQNQLNSLTGLHSTKPAVSRLASFLNQVTPANANINSLTVTFTSQGVALTGTADALSTVNQYVDTLKFTTYKTGPAPDPANCPLTQTAPVSTAGTASSSAASLNSKCTIKTTSDAKPAFTAVVLTAFSVTAHEATYTVTFNYDPAIFDITQGVVLTVPAQVTTRSQLNQPKELFVLPVDGTTTKVKAN